MSALDEYRQDLPEFISGRLDAKRAGEIAQLAETDAELRQAIESERALDSVLELYEVDGPGNGFEDRFWREFHESRTLGGGAGWLLKLAGPLAACVLLAIGAFLFMNLDSEETGAPLADSQDNAPAPVVEVTWEESEFDYLGGDAPDTQRRLDAETLSELKTLDDANFSPLDDMENPEDLLVIDNLELLNELAELEDDHLEGE